MEIRNAKTGRRARLSAAASVLALCAVSACASFPQLQASPVLERAGAGSLVNAAPPGQDRVHILATPAPDAEASPSQTAATATIEQINALLEPRDVRVTLPPQPLPQFIDTVFGEILRVPYSTGPGVAQRRDIIALRGPETVANTRLFSMAQMALAQYGLAVVIDAGGVRIIQDTVLSGQAPAFIRSRTSPNTPASSQPTMQFFAVSSIDVEALLPMLEQAYPNRGSVRFTAQAETNTLLISGGGREVAAAAAVVRELDVPRFQNGQVARIETIFLSPEQLADALVRTLDAEGYRVSSPVEARRGAINILPLDNANQLLVFANDQRLFDRALYWVGQLDRAAALGNGQGVFVYTVRNTSAEELGALVHAGAGSGGAATALMPPEQSVRRSGGVRASAQQAPESVATSASVEGLTVDAAGNRILFRGSASEYERLRSLLEQLDTPPRQVLIELTIAEVTLTDETRFGVEWFLEQTISNGTLSASTRGGSTRQPGGLGLTAMHVFTRGTVEAAFNAFASNHNLNILSTPRVFTRSGSEAQIMIGTDVPIITSQRASNNQTGGDTDVLQTVQYRQTGVILNVRPIVYGDDRIDISLYQEVSSQQPNTSAAINSPLILNRSVTTQISLQEGMTAVIGGMIQDNYSRDQRGIPGLKDIPFIGAAFRSEEVTGDKVELVILVTPHIVRDADDMSAITESMTASVNRALRRRGPQVYTLYPWRAPFMGARSHNQLHPAVSPSGPIDAAQVLAPASSEQSGEPIAPPLTPEQAPAPSAPPPREAAPSAPPPIEDGPQSLLPTEPPSPPAQP